jgi:nicotinate-nucleotide pyrophosphorylase (carboxylating)
VPEFQQIPWGQQVDDDCRAIVRLAIAEDLGQQQDWTTVALVAADRQGGAHVVTREPGIVAGMPAVELVIEEMEAKLTATCLASDGQAVAEGTTLVGLQGNVRDLLTLERTLLNLLSRMMGVATLAGKYVQEVQATTAKVYDTRKTTPGWRRLEKYAAHCGGASNHRMGLYDAILIKDNHLAQRGHNEQDAAVAVAEVRKFLAAHPDPTLKSQVLEIEVDTLQQLKAVLPARPEIVLLDNMTLGQLEQAVVMRNQLAPEVQLEASGGVNLATVREIAQTGVERISVGAITHSARSLDLGLDWQS